MAGAVVAVDQRHRRGDEKHGVNPDESTAGNKFDMVQELDNFWIHGRREILGILKQLIQGSTTVTVHFNNHVDFILTMVLGIDLKRDLLILDEGPNERLNTRLSGLPKVTCKAMLQNVQIRFECSRISRARFQGRGVFVCPIPDTLFYLERRESFRVPTPTTNPPHCSLHLVGGEAIELPVVDISASGLGMHNPRMQVDLQSQETVNYTNCGLFLPGFGDASVDLQLRNFRHVTLKNGDEVQRVGAMFIHLPPRTETLIQRYVNHLQIKQIAMAKST